MRREQEEQHMGAVLFDDWQGIVRVFVVGTLAYAAIVIALRASGKRTLSKMNAFDLIVTVALGSTLAMTMLSKNTALAEGITAMLLLILLQLVVTWLSVRSQRFQSLVKAQPALLVRDGRMILSAMLAERVTSEEILAAVRGSGNSQLEENCSVVLETDGSLSVVFDVGDIEGNSSLGNVRRGTAGGKRATSNR
jgi:uncharacterized membrane protein YcaP (DUF421 family)